MLVGKIADSFSVSRQNLRFANAAAGWFMKAALETRGEPGGSDAGDDTESAHPMVALDSHGIDRPVAEQLQYPCELRLGSRI